MAIAGFDGTKAEQTEAIISTIRAFYNWIPMILSIILFVAFVTTFRLDRDMENLRSGK
ncbi:MAG: hypothetical protein K5779_01660 [Saccharofermentans sp.]|nr:hypothetical protein [Saccharofermentans sp.]